MVSASRGPSAPLGVLVLLATATVAAVVILPSIPAAHAASGPSTVGVTTSQNGLGFAADDYVCGANGRFWVFYYNGVNWGWQSSTDGQTWSSFTSFTTAVPGPAGGTNNMAFYCSGATDTVYYAGGEQDTDAHFYFNSGTLNADGSITWGTEAAVSTEGYNVKYPSITQDSAGDVWVAVQSQNTGGGGPYYIEVYEMVSSIWGQSLALSFSGYLPIPQLVAFSDGDIALLYGTNSIAVGLETYAGSWTAGPSTTATNYNALLSTAVAVGTNIEYCASTGSSIYLLSYAFGGSWSTPSSSFASGDACSAATDGSAVLGLFYASATTITYDQSNNGGSTFAAPQTLSTAESGVTVVGAGLAESSNPAKQVMAVWLSGSASPYSVRFVNVSTAPVVNEEITISETNGGPVASATVSGCHATVTSIPMDGASHTFGADPSCSLTISVPTDGSFSRYRFPGTSTTWTFTTGSTSPDVHTTSVYYQYLITAYYTVAGGSGAPPAPTLTSTETGLPIAPTLSTTASPYWLDAGASWSVPASLTSGGTTWTTAPSSGTVSSPDTFDFVYSPPVTVTSTVVSVSVSVTTTTVFLAGSAVPSASSLTCAQVQAQVNHRIQCTDLVYTADNGTAAGSVTWTTSGGGSFSNEQCSYGGNGNYFQGTGDQSYENGELQCQADYTPTASGVQTLTASYAGDPYHASSSASVLVFVGDTASSKATFVSLSCDEEYVTLGQSTNCQATVTTADGNKAAGSMQWSATDAGTFSRTSCQTYNGYGSGQLTCYTRYTPASAGPEVVTATYVGDPSHLSSSGTFEVFVSSPNRGLAQKAAILLPTGALLLTGLSVVVLEARKGRAEEKKAA